jgi:hypothetical protein
MYPEDDAAATDEEDISGTSRGNILGILLIGCLVSGGIATVIHFMVARFISPTQVSNLARIVLFLAGPLGSLLGGYITAGLARQRAKLLGGLIGVLSLPVSVLLASRWVEINLAALFTLWILGAGVLIILAGVCGGWLNEIYSHRGEWQEMWRIRGWEDLLYQDLLRKVRFNGTAADRLIEYERNLEPGASRMKLIQNAIERWEKDNR